MGYIYYILQLCTFAGFYVFVIRFYLVNFPYLGGSKKRNTQFYVIEIKHCYRYRVRYYGKWY